ncbi:hypothetical protein BC834DRAFT_843584 [Gloeopeniophorella convolvens]|nr:hypothetical protein BC834DRAFT_843584 [Gloeopeniophorella convolvens]
MFRFGIASFFVVFAQLLLLGHAAPLESRQIGGIACNANRLGIVLTLKSASGTAKGLATSLANTSDATNVQAIQTGIKGAQGAIDVIGKALLSGQTAPADARNQVQGNLTSAIDALSRFNSTSTDVTKLGSQLTSAVNAGLGVVSDCK